MSFVSFVLFIGLCYLYWKKIQQIMILKERVENQSSQLAHIKNELEKLAESDIDIAKDLLERFHEEKNYFGYIHGGFHEDKIRSFEEFRDEMVIKYLRKKL